MKLLYQIYIIVALFTAQHREGLKTLDEISHWNFELDGRSIDVKLSSYAHAHRPNATVISYTFAHDSSPISTHEEAQVLGKVFQEMKSSGYDPGGLEMISFPIEGTTLKEDIDRAVSNSPTWRSCIGRKYCPEAKKIADDFLTSTNNLRELDERLHASGLQIVRAATDDVACKVTGNRMVQSNDSPRHAGTASCAGIVYIETWKKGRCGLIHTRQGEVNADPHGIGAVAVAFPSRDEFCH
jgi:hypothetical protein